MPVMILPFKFLDRGGFGELLGLSNGARFSSHQERLVTRPNANRIPRKGLRLFLIAIPWLPAEMIGGFTLETGRLSIMQPSRRGSAGSRTITFIIGPSSE
jgi:hypothetical protein